GPLFAPSSACARQKYERPVASGSGRRSEVRPPSPGETPSRSNTLFVKPASRATSNTYDNGRTPLLDEFSMSSDNGCSSTAILARTTGSRTFGAEISTPGIGPATVGLRGFELFELWHAVRVATAVQTLRADSTLRIINIHQGNGHSRSTCVRAMRIFSIG